MRTIDVLSRALWRGSSRLNRTGKVVSIEPDQYVQVLLNDSFDIISSVGAVRDGGGNFGVERLIQTADGGQPWLAKVFESQRAASSSF